jgi:hypothetical protein
MKKLLLALAAFGLLGSGIVSAEEAPAGDAPAEKPAKKKAKKAKKAEGGEEKKEEAPAK